MKCHLHDNRNRFVQRYHVIVQECHVIVQGYHVIIQEYHVIVQKYPVFVHGYHVVDQECRSLYRSTISLFRSTMSRFRSTNSLFRTTNLLIYYLFSLQSLPYTKSNARFVERLICMQGHPQFISDPEEEKAPFGAVDGALPDQLIEALRVQLTTNLANAGFAGLTLL